MNRRRLIQPHQTMFTRAQLLRTVSLIVVLVATSSCDPGCGFFQTGCEVARFNDAMAIQLSVSTSVHEFRIDDGAMVRVVLRNGSTKPLIIPDQKCGRPFYVFDETDQPVGDSGRICNRDSWGAVTLARGDSIVWTADIRSEIRNFGRELPTGTYAVKGRVQYGLGEKYSNPDSLRIIGK